jgi:hypothetical protein
MAWSVSVFELPELPNPSPALRWPTNLANVCFDRPVKLTQSESDESVRAEGVGFEPTVGKPTPVFKTGTFGRSVIPPGTTLSGGYFFL